ncbi:cupin domain-containing protein [Albimonas sp. CAU 1670]|uniref:cupin domain-containing protein n=1 Tax=Albimonas sp. CAU 1670 TaxID=3032599 RepID=UPI0023DCA92A|nr:cupin domain-containing protein [Albimonas sp. CAU 1670]MDF2232902.1 cupin domain-containing protein [Albimonas sp. CAU 1670]
MISAAPVTDAPAVLRGFLPAVLAGGWTALPFDFFREGVEIHRLAEGPAAVALLRYAPGASVPRHRHTGLETIVVLEGTQSDDNGVARAGDVVFNPEGSVHSVWSEDGCVVLIHWTRPVEFVEPA